MARLEVVEQSNLSDILSHNLPLEPSEVVSLQRRIAQLEGELHHHRAAVSTARLLSLETLGHIFAFVFTDRGLNAKERETLLNLGLVSKHWRHATLYNHHLWGRINLEAAHLNPAAYDKIIAWLKRSGDTPRTIEFLEDPYASEEFPDWPPDRECTGSELCLWRNPIVIRLLAEGPSLDRVALGAVSVGCLFHLMGSLKSWKKNAPHSQMPWNSLKTLALPFRQCRWVYTTEDGTAKSVFHDLPDTIQYLQLWLPAEEFAFQHDNAIPLLDMPQAFLKNLVSFEIQINWESSDLLAALASCSNLETLVVDLAISRFDVDEDEGNTQGPVFQQLADTGICLPKLRRLQLREQAVALELLRYLVTPVLEDLDIGYSKHKMPPQLHHQGLLDSPFAETVLPFIKERSGCQSTLRSLRILNRKIPSEELVSVLIELPSITHLTLDQVTIDHDSLWESLREHAQAAKESKLAVPLRHLAVLNLLGLKRLPFFFNRIFEFLIEVRGRKGCQLVISLPNGGISRAVKQYERYKAPDSEFEEKFKVALSILPAAEE
ncbi:hypothetical protein DFP72DRAFT_890884 [Ephemerocybe angulata]|uniref:F-box domain-containing protein n=1 Tax=Ephemerocybe angulata TaxID=980116 RepID=A0A8H6I204_9AGAR|nr:hypothetical protein DFP72DRAFT_918618 [Tulosesus angulatus]KAF6757330.1 hypothetical protein DFP72DRAFT_890884 [Tulosesus angulatus]